MSINSALTVNAGIEHPPQVNPNALLQRRRKLPLLSAEEYADGIASGSRTILGRAITLVESALPEHQALARRIIELCLPRTGNTIRIGITGPPGVGKSSFIEAIGGYITGLGNKLAVLAIDPSSECSKGSILGDKTRMETLSANPAAFIRPSPSACTLGGVARKTRESIVLCEAAGYNVIFVETVGVGQCETQVHSMVDCFLLLALAGAGDELQGIKRGIMELVDIIAITKADGENLHRAMAARAQSQSALNLFPQPQSQWKPAALMCSATEKTGLTEVWKNVLDFVALTQQNGYFYANRSRQSIDSMHETIREMLLSQFYLDPRVQRSIPEMEAAVMQKNTDGYTAANRLLAIRENP